MSTTTKPKKKIERQFGFLSKHIIMKFIAGAYIKK